MGNMAEYYLKAENLAYSYNTDVLFSSLSFDLPKGTILQITGKNGSGKTTLLHLLSQILALQVGKILWDVPFAYVSHKNGIKAEFLPLENLSLYQPDLWLCTDALDRMGVETVAHQKPCYMLSAGQQRKVALSRLILSDAQVWIVDEPFTALDTSAKACFTYQLEHHIDSGGSAIIATHEPIETKQAIIALGLP
jgi:heme exporter protein A